MLRILGKTTSINVRKAIWAAAECGFAYRVEESYARDDTSAGRDIRALNPNALAPVLVTDEGALWESNTICRYLAARAAREDLLPTAPFARAHVEKWMDWQATDLNFAWRPAFTTLLRGDASWSAEQVTKSTVRWNALMLLLERRLEETAAYVAGGDFTLADIGIGLSLQRWLLTPIERPDAPALAAYRSRLLGRAAAQSLDSAQP